MMFRLFGMLKHKEVRLCVYLLLTLLTTQVSSAWRRVTPTASRSTCSENTIKLEQGWIKQLYQCIMETRTSKPIWSQRMKETTCPT